jgi:hypothetical protein
MPHATGAGAFLTSKDLASFLTMAPFPVDAQYFVPSPRLKHTSARDVGFLASPSGRDHVAGVRAHSRPTQSRAVIAA